MNQQERLQLARLLQQQQMFQQQPVGAPQSFGGAALNALGQYLTDNKINEFAQGIDQRQQQTNQALAGFLLNNQQISPEIMQQIPQEALFDIVQTQDKRKMNEFEQQQALREFGLRNQSLMQEKAYRDAMLGMERDKLAMQKAKEGKLGKDDLVTVLDDAGNEVFVPASEAVGKKAAKKSQEQKAPAGYRYNAQGTLEPIPGGPASKLSGDVAGRVSLSETVLGYFPEIESTLIDNFDRTDYNLGRGATGRANNKLREAVGAAIYAKTGAAATPKEIDEQMDLYAPSTFDTAETRKNKITQLKNFLQNYVKSARNTAAPLTPENDFLGLGANNE